MNFHVGQKVVCVNADHDFVSELGDPNMDGLRRGAIYTVRWAGTLVHPAFGTHPAVKLDELVRPVCLYWGGEVPYHRDRFRPMDERKTDISIFTEILAGASKQAESVG